MFLTILKSGAAGPIVVTVTRSNALLGQQVRQEQQSTTLAIEQLEISHAAIDSLYLSIA